MHGLMKNMKCNCSRAPPQMGNMLTYKGIKSFHFTFKYPDENYAREVSNRAKLH